MILLDPNARPVIGHRGNRAHAPENTLPSLLEAVALGADAVEFDVRSESPEGDIKVEMFGDGLNHSSGYVLIHGGWNNSISIISRLDEHGTSLQALETKAAKLAKGVPCVGSNLRTADIRPVIPTL